MNSKLDQEADEKGRVAVELVDKVSKNEGDMNFTDGDALDFQKVVIMLQDRMGIVRHPGSQTQ